jgi:hypothetical protein
MQRLSAVAGATVVLWPSLPIEIVGEHTMRSKRKENMTLMFLRCTIFSVSVRRVWLGRRLCCMYCFKRSWAPEISVPVFVLHVWS